MKTTRPLIEVAMKQCGNKCAFTSEVAAKRFMHAMRWAGKTNNALNVYRCDFCGYWHWGHIPRRAA